MDTTKQNWNTGDWNTGNWNTGDQNNGNRNSGCCNSGYWNSGDFNHTDGSTGAFNTIEQTIYLFDQPSDWTLTQWRESEAHMILFKLMTSPVKWVGCENMSDKEKQEHPEYSTAGGYLKTLSQEERFAQNVQRWKALSDDDKAVILAIPNFDAEIFKQITGIDARAPEGKR